MAFKMSASDVAEVFNYLSNQCPGSNIEISIEHNESKLYIRATNKRDEVVKISVAPAEVSIFPTLTKEMRLKDDK